MSKVMCTALNTEQGPHLELLKAQGFEVLHAPRDRSLFEEQNLIDLLKDCEAVVAGSEPYTRRVLESLPKLRVIARTGVGFDAIDLATCDERGIVVTTTPGVNHHAVAEHTIALLMGVARGFPERDRMVREFRWKRVSAPRVMGRTLGIVGLGRIGRAVATRGAGLGMQLLAYDPYPNEEFAEQWNIELVSLDDLLARSDYVTLHLPMAPGTKHLMNAAAFRKMKPGSVLINTARGALVDEKALYDALKSGHLRGAGLDVFEVEPLPADSPLLELNNVLLSGHVAGLDDESQRDTLQMAAETLIALRDGGWPTLCIRNLPGVTNWKW